MQGHGSTPLAPSRWLGRSKERGQALDSFPSPIRKTLASGKFCRSNTAFPKESGGGVSSAIVLAAWEVFLFWQGSRTKRKSPPAGAGRLGCIAVRMARTIEKTVTFEVFPELHLPRAHS